MYSRARNQDDGTRACIRCIVAEDHVLLRQGLRRLLEDQPDIEVVAEAANEAETLQRALEHKPDVVLVGSGIFGLAADDAAPLIRKESPHSLVLFLSGAEKNSAVVEGRAEDVRSTARNTSIDDLVGILRAASQDANREVRTMPRRDRDEGVASEAYAPRSRELTLRESEVLKLLAEGKTVRSAAQILGVSIKTADAHKFNLMRKLGVHNKAELVMCAIQRKVIKVPANF